MLASALHVYRNSTLHVSWPVISANCLTFYGAVSELEARVEQTDRRTDERTATLPVRRECNNGP